MPPFIEDVDEMEQEHQRAAGGRGLFTKRTNDTGATRGDTAKALAALLVAALIAWLVR